MERPRPGSRALRGLPGRTCADRRAGRAGVGGRLEGAVHAHHPHPHRRPPHPQGYGPDMNDDGLQNHHGNGHAPGRDITPRPDLAHDAPRAGPVRARRPVYLDLLPPCNAGCPAGENIQAWLAEIQAGRPEGAWRQLVADNPLPAIHGRVCYHPCESVCNRAQLDSSVSIHAGDRYLGDLALEKGWALDPAPVPATGHRVLVIGAGPSGLSAAYHLARRGHEVEIRDAGDQPGGMMRYGIPSYRMPRDVLAGEIKRIEALGVTMTCGHPVTDLAAERREGNFDAVFVAVGAHLS